MRHIKIKNHYIILLLPEMYNSIQKVKTIHILLLKIAPSKTFHDLTGREGRADQNNKSHCIIVLPPQMSNYSVWEK